MNPTPRRTPGAGRLGKACRTALRCAVFAATIAAASPPVSPRDSPNDDREFVSPGVSNGKIASEIVGNYTLSGVQANGEPYTGTGEIMRLGGPIYEFTWTTAHGTFHGVGLRKQDLVLGAWGGARNDRAAVYTVAGNVLDGVWFGDETGERLGRETLTGGASDLSGSFVVSGAFPDGGTYGGIATSVVSPGGVLRFVFQLNGKSRVGWGLRESSLLVVGSDEVGSTAPMRYTITHGGQVLEGVFVDPRAAYLGTGSETMTRI